MPDKQMLVEAVGAQFAAVRLVDLGDGTFGFVLAGNVASGAADSGNPTKVGGVYRVTLPTLVDGQRGDAQYDQRGGQFVVLKGVNAANTAAATITTPSDGVSNAVNLLFANSWTSTFNGNTWDRDRKAISNARLLSAAASTNPTLVKSSAGDLFGVTIGANAVAAKRYLKIYNKASAPTVGTDTPIFTLEIPASAANWKWAPDGGKPFYFPLGIAFALTTGQPDADTGALAAGDILSLNMQYH